MDDIARTFWCFAHLSSHLRESPGTRMVSCMTSLAGGVRRICLTSLLPSLRNWAETGWYDEDTHDLSMRSEPEKSTFTVATSMGPLKLSGTLLSFNTCNHHLAGLDSRHNRWLIDVNVEDTKLPSLLLYE